MDVPIIPTHIPAATLAGSPYPGEVAAATEGRALPPAPVCTWCDYDPTSCPHHPRPAAPSSSLDHSETSVSTPVQAFLQSGEKPQIHYEIDPWSSSAVRFRHNGWKPQRDRVIASLKRTQQSSSRVDAFCSCGAGTWLQRRDDAKGMAEYRICGSCCHDRLCTPCANVRAQRLRLSLMAIMKGKRVSFITLTLAGKDQGLGEKVDRLYKHFKALRLHPLWADNVRGGAAFLEVKWSDKAKRWHPHLHIIADASFIDQGELSTVWRTISHDSYIVDIRKVRDDEEAAGYVTKYASKPMNTSFSNSPVLLDEAVIALKGRRLAFAFGEWYGEALDFDSDSLLDEGEEMCGEWTNYMCLEELLDRCNHGDPESIALLTKAGGEARWRISLG